MVPLKIGWQGGGWRECVGKAFCLYHGDSQVKHASIIHYVNYTNVSNCHKRLCNGFRQIKENKSERYCSGKYQLTILPCFSLYVILTGIDDIHF